MQASKERAAGSDRRGSILRSSPAYRSLGTMRPMRTTDNGAFLSFAGAPSLLPRLFPCCAGHRCQRRASLILNRPSPFATACEFNSPDVSRVTVLLLAEVIGHAGDNDAFAQEQGAL